jgi:tetratricopeptide (TPR) repeat protein
MGEWSFFGSRKIKKLKADVEDHPQSAEAHFNLGAAYEELGCVAEAIEAFQKTLHLHSRSAEAHFNLGVLYEELDEGKNAIIHMNKAGTLFSERGDGANKDRARKRLRGYYQKFGFEAKDIEGSIDEIQGPS